MAVNEYLFRGAENAQTARELCKILHCTNRELQKWIERERKAGAPICASMTDPQGFYLAATPAEMTAYCESLQRRVNEINGTLTACKLTAERMATGTDG